MKTNLLATICILNLIIIAISGTALAQTVAVSVARGNTFDYSYTLLWDSTDPTANVPSEYVDLNNTQSIRITIASVSGPLIQMDVTKYFKNGTETTQNGNTDVDKQIIDVPYSFLVIRANANPNEKIYPSGGHATLGDKQTRTYPIGQIETIHYLSTTTSGTNYEKTEIFFDRATGVAAEYQYELQETSGSYVTTTKEILILERANLGTQTDFPWYMILLTLIVASLLLLILARKLRKRPTKTAEQNNAADNSNLVE